MLEAKKIEYTFTVEMKSKKHVKSISISDEAHDRVLFEGTLGKLMELSLVEGDVLEFIGAKGILRVAVTEEQLRKVLRKASQLNLSSEVGSYTSTKKSEKNNGLR